MRVAAKIPLSGKHSSEEQDKWSSFALVSVLAPSNLSLAWKILEEIEQGALILGRHFDSAGT
ncbi:hypothetical protein CK218_28340 [Mesorhizobium sp. WSM3879]|nr:hypothetical protein CK218_28340 [Mesorhizobium sp. WSM3879]PBB89652.1 hypothetical protein CK215_26135 [Mesorhizobium sp. WSM3864]